MLTLNKKGNVFSIFIIIVILLAVALFGLVFSRMIFGFTDSIGDIQMIKDTPTAAQANQQLENSNIPVADGMVFFLFLTSFIGLIIAAVYTKFSPVVIFLFILLIIIGVFASGLAANIYSDMASSPSMTDTSQHLSMTNIILSKYTPMIIGVMAIIIIIIMYSKSGDDI
jgi:hypothetical protein